ncbi:hypothetical protein A0H81_00063 [Grifola frondosa]|uniref:Uncharacterized protein n=1 Tax=Grifola frondosa TaxID=5627 RepID=A0A1C7MRW9_GRIFR|nr:hypothetical protein A0H81_00063 [Grifola frondosa]
MKSKNHLCHVHPHIRRHVDTILHDSSRYRGTNQATNSRYATRTLPTVAFNIGHAYAVVARIGFHLAPRAISHTWSWSHSRTSILATLACA